MCKFTINIIYSLLILLTGGHCKEFVADISKEPYIYEAESLPTINDSTDDWNTRLTPTIGNGHISTHLWNDTVYINGLYNGYFGQTHRARLEAQHSMWLTIDGVPENETERRHSLDTKKGIFTSTIITSHALVTYITYAHQYYNRLLVTDVTVKRDEVSDGRDIIVRITKRVGNASEDLKVAENTTYNGYQFVSVKTRITEFNDSDVISAFIAFTPLNESTIILKNDSMERRKVYVFGADMKTEENLKSDLDNVKRLLNEHDGENKLLRMHVAGWERIWKQGRIELEGNLEAQKAITSSFYYMYSSLPSMNTSTPSNMFWGISPGGLANGAPKVDYYGHVFWDMDTWMFPGILMFRPDLAKAMLDYRMYTMPPSFKRAKEGGYNGTRFPWESAYTGQEVCPKSYMAWRENQQHITGDIAYAAQQYMSATRDTTWLTKPHRLYNYTGFRFVKEMANFWESRPSYDKRRDQWEINGVMPPDEHQLSVNNSVYTNAMAAYSVNYARYAACLAGKDQDKEVPQSWIQKMNKLVFPYNEKHRYHEEFEGYQHELDTNTSTPKGVKQADAILLGFPLMWNMPDDVRRNDLEHYEKVTNRDGPAMTWGMFCINWLELGDKTEADRMFDRSFKTYIRQPFKLWTEAQKGVGAINFVTGMGGFLQTLVFGYGGLRLHYEELEFLPASLPPNTTKMTLFDLQYLGATFDLKIDANGTKIIVKEVDRKMNLSIQQGGIRAEVLVKGKTYDMKSSRFHIYSGMKTHCDVPTHFIDVNYGVTTKATPTTTTTDYQTTATSSPPPITTQPPSNTTAHVSTTHTLQTTNTTQPITRTTTPPKTSTKPLNVTTTPLETTTTLPKTSTKPLNVTSTPLETTTTLPKTSTKPLNVTTTPLETTTTPPKTTTVPLNLTTTPLETTTTPLKTTTAPLNMTTTPLKTTTTPLTTKEQNQTDTTWSLTTTQHSSTTTGAAAILSCHMMMVVLTILITLM